MSHCYLGGVKFAVNQLFYWKALFIGANTNNLKIEASQERFIFIQ